MSFDGHNAIARNLFRFWNAQSMSVRRCRFSVRLNYFFLNIPPPPRSTLFPYTTLFRSLVDDKVIEKAPGNRFRIVGATPPPVVVDAKSGKATLPAGWVAGSLRVHPAGYGFVARDDGEDRKSTRLNSSHANISYAVFCLK